MNFANILIVALSFFYRFLEFMIFVRVILSWLPFGRDNFIVKIVYEITEPILGPIRRLINKSPIGGGILDFSPIIAFFFLYYILIFLVEAIRYFS